MKTPQLALCALMTVAALMAAPAVTAQETAARGVQEVQASFSTLKTLINEVRGTAKLALDTAIAAQASATVAFNMSVSNTQDIKRLKITVDGIRLCSKAQKFFDPMDFESDYMGCVDPFDDDARLNLLLGTSQVRNLDDDDNVKAVSKSAHMMLSYGCTVIRDSTICRRNREGMAFCTPAAPVKWEVGLGKGANQFMEIAGGTAKGYSMVGGGGTEPGVYPAPTVVASGNFFSFKGKLYEGRMVMTPLGVRVTDKKFVTDMDKWNGEIKFKNCAGSVRAFYYNKI